MSIRARVVVSTAAVGVTLLALSFGVAYFSLMAGMHRLERVEVTDSLSRAVAAIDEKTTGLDLTARDWSVWDPLDRFTVNPSSSPSFVSENIISPATMANVGVDVFVIADNKGSVVCSGAIAPGTLEETRPPVAAVSYAVRRATSPAGQVANSSIKGMMSTAGGPMMIVAQPILHSDGSGPVAGTLLFGRYLDKNNVAAIEQIAQMRVALYAAGDSALATGLAEVRSALASGDSPVIREIDSGQISGFETLRGVGGDTAILGVTIPRTVLGVAQDSSMRTGLWMLLVVGVSTGSLYLTLDYAVIRRLSKLGKDVSNVAASGDLARRVEPKGRDEIGQLSGEINRMLDSVENASDRLLESNLKLERMVHDVAESMGRVVEQRDPYTQGHQERVARLSGKIAREMGLSADEVSFVEFAGTVHDIGKLGIPAEILSRPGRLSEAEFSLIREHSLRGHEILSGIDFPWPVADIVLQHHERMDGSGYPSGLVNGAILLEARILAVADVVEAMASHRPYRPSLGVDAAIAQLRSEPEKFDADVVAACVGLWESGRLGL